MSTTTQTHGEGDEQAAKSLFAVHEKVYPKSVAGKYRKLKWAALVILLAIYYLAPWLRWDRGPRAPDQAVLADIAGRAALFLRHRDLAAGDLLPDRPADHGRRSACSWRPRCSAGSGAASPARRRSGPISSCRSSARSKATGRSASASTRRPGRRPNGEAGRQASGLAADGVPHRRRLDHVFPRCAHRGRRVLHRSGRPTPSPSSSVLFTATTYLLAGWAREQVCTYMCPWPRIQGAMVDQDTPGGDI